jgi:tetratricopeptide (TPR) repeat protein
MLRFTPAAKTQRVAVAEVELLGREGPPATLYEFKETPAKAFDVLARLKTASAVDVPITADEAALFADVKDGRFQKWSFDEAALLASGVLESDRRKTYLKQLDGLEAEAAKATAGGGTPFEKGQKLLAWLHEKKSGTLKKYVAKQTDLSVILDTGTYNCVSSAVFYNVLARRLGLDVRAIEVPDHAFSILYDGKEHADVETTTGSGFNPLRDQAAQKEFEEKTGFRYIPDRDRKRRREVGDAGLVAIIYYNHGVLLTKDKRHHEALVAYFRAMSLDPEFASAVKNALASLANWGVELAKQKEFDKARQVVTIGLELAPKDATLRNNLIYVYQEGAVQLLTAGKPAEVNAWLEGGIKQFPDRPELQRLRGDVYLGHAARLIRKKSWPAAADAVAVGLANVPDAKEARKGVGYLAQEWSREAYKKDGTEKAEAVLADLRRRFPDVPEVKAAARTYVFRVSEDLRRAGKSEEALGVIDRGGKLIDDPAAVKDAALALYDRLASERSKNKDWPGAIEVYVKALEKYPGDKHLAHNEVATWESWARTYRNVKDWDKAIEVYQKGLKRYPNEGVLKQNLRYCEQQKKRK